eukprot:scaffold30926_cov62-Phaeocystis_antarctica.AAC.15
MALITMACLAEGCVFAGAARRRRRRRRRRRLDGASQLPQPLHLLRRRLAPARQRGTALGPLIEGLRLWLLRGADEEEGGRALRQLGRLLLVERSLLDDRSVELDHAAQVAQHLGSGSGLGLDHAEHLVVGVGRAEVVEELAVLHQDERALGPAAPQQAVPLLEQRAQREDRRQRVRAPRPALLREP